MGESINQKVSDSEFYMWRAIFAFSLSDHVLTLEKQDLLQSYLTMSPFSATQLSTLKADFGRPQNVEALYKKITNPAHKERFCVLARALAWSDGDMQQQEAAILRKVACLGNGADDDVLRRTRHHPHLDDYYQQYAKAGMVGLYKMPPNVEMRV